MEVIDLSEVNPTGDVLNLLTPELARKYEAFPVGTTGAEVEVVLGNPLDENVQSDLEFHLKKSVNPKVAYRGAVLQGIDEAYGSAEDRKMHDFFEDMNEDELEIGDGVRPEEARGSGCRQARHRCWPAGSK